MSLSASERETRGKDERAAVPRSSHAAWSPPAGRRDPVDVLEDQGATRVPDLVPIRYGRMLASPFAFYRGAAAIFAADVATTPRTGIRAQLCGDAHIANFGIYRAPDRSLVFDLNDFDETIPGPWEWDVKRMAASVEIAGRHVALRHAERRTAVTWGVEAYRQAMREFAQMDTLDVWYVHLDVTGAAERFSERVEKADLAEVRRRSPRPRAGRTCGRCTSSPGTSTGSCGSTARRRCSCRSTTSAPPRRRRRSARRMSDLLEAYAQSLPDDRRHLFHQYRLVDLARKVVGVGSVGTRAWVLLLEGRDEQDPLILQAKEAVRSVLEPYAGASAYEQQGRRVVEGQRLMQAASDILLGWQQVDRSRRGLPRLLPAPALGREGLGRPRDDGRAASCACTRACAAGRSRAPTPAPGTGRRSPPTSAAGRLRRGDRGRSRAPTPTRTSVTSPRCRPPPRAGGSRSSAASDRRSGGRELRRSSTAARAAPPSSARQLVDRDALLRERVAVAHGDRAVLERLVVDRHAPRRADLVLAAVALADRAALVVLGLHDRPRSALVDLAGELGLAVLAHERQHGDLDRRQARVQLQHRALLARDLLLVVGVDEEGERRAVGAGGRLDHVRDVALARCPGRSTRASRRSARRAGVRSKSPRLAMPSSSDQPIGNRYSTSLVPRE